jgi:hypothetical protein
MGKIYVGDIGTEITIDLGEDISAATVMRIDVIKGDKTTAQWAAAASGSTAIQYLTVADDLNVPGVYLLNAYIELPGWKGHAETITMIVSTLGK